MSVSREGQISAIIADWISTMDYLTGADMTPMLEAVSQNSIDGISLRSIREKVQDSGYTSLNEFIYEFEKLLQHENDILSSASSADIAAVEDLNNIDEGTLAKVFAVYKLFLLGQYLSDWREKTSRRVDEDSTTIEKLYTSIVRGKPGGNVAKQRGRKTLDEKPQRASKRISEILRRSEQEISGIISESEGSEDNILEEKSDAKPSLEQMEKLSLGESEKIPTNTSQKMLGFEKDQRKARIQISPMKRRMQTSELSHQMVSKKYRNEDKGDLSGPCSSSAVLPRQMNVVGREKRRRSRKRNVRFIFGKTKVRNNLKYKQTKMKRILEQQSRKQAQQHREDVNNNNHNNNNESSELTLDTSEISIEGESECVSLETNVNNNNNNDDLQIIEVCLDVQVKKETEAPISVAPVEESSLQQIKQTPHPVSDAKPVRPIAAVSFYNNYRPVHAPQARNDRVRHSPHYNQYFPRYPYTTYPPLNSSPFDRFYARHKVPSFSLFRHNFTQPRPQYRPDYHYRHPNPHSKSYY